MEIKRHKLMPLNEAIARFVSNGSSIALGTAQETLIPFAAGHEIMRQQKRDLTLIGPISDMLFDQMIGAGCVGRVRAAWVGNVITGSGYNFRRAVERGEIEMEDHSNLMISMALRAGAMGVPFMPTRTGLGSDLYRTNPNLKEIVCPFTGDKLTAVAAITPDLAIIHVQRADQTGAAHMWGNMGITREACLASRQVIITAEEIVPPGVIRSDPNRVVVPAFKVAAVVHSPWGAHPSPVPGFYNRDHDAFLDYQATSRSLAQFEKWRADWVTAVQTSQDYMAKLGQERIQSLQINESALAAEVDYGF